MNIVFFGTSEFAMPALRVLLDSRHKVLALVTQPDSRRGRNLKLSPPPTKALALNKGIPVYQPKDASSRESAEYLKKIGADLFVVVAFGQILKREILSIPEYGAINLHGSLLPKYRGAAPTNWSIINGDAASGVTIIKMNERMDEGDIVLSKAMPIDKDDTNITLSEKLSELGAKAILEAIAMIEEGRVNFTRQDHKNATYVPKLNKEDGLIDWNEDAVRIHNRVKGLLPWPGAYTHYDKKILKILGTEIVSAAIPEDSKPGEVIGIVKGKGFFVRAGSGVLAITRIQLEGKKPLDADSFLRGHRIRTGHIFG